MRCAALGNWRGLRFLLLSHSVRGDIANSGNVKTVEHSSDSVYPREILCTLVRFCVPSSDSLFQPDPREMSKMIKPGFPRVISNQQDSTVSTQQQNNSQYSLQIKSNRLNHLFWRPELIKLMTRFMVLMLTRAHANTAKTKANAVIGRQMVILKIRKSGETDYWWAGERLSLWMRWTTWILKKHALHIF